VATVDGGKIKTKTKRTRRCESDSAYRRWQSSAAPIIIRYAVIHYETQTTRTVAGTAFRCCHGGVGWVGGVAWRKCPTFCEPRVGAMEGEMLSYGDEG
jgi:hypothetical protein